MDGRPISRRQKTPAQAARPHPLEDAELIEQVRAGNTECFGELVRKYQDRVFNACWRICGHLEDARDLTQEAFLKAFNGLAGFRQQSGFYTWIFRVAVNLSVSHRRHEGRRRQVSWDPSPGAGESQGGRLPLRVAHPSDEPAQTAGEAELQACVARALNRLDADHRAVVVLRDMEGFDYREIARILDIPSGTVKSRLHRARMQLRNAIVSAGQA